MTEPNVRVRLLRTRVAPGTPVLATPLTIWWLGTRFRVRDESGRPCAHIVADMAAPRGFGRTPRTMEDFMDAAASPRLPDDHRYTDLYGDLGAEWALVDEPWNPPWEVPVPEVAAVAAQVLAGDLGGLTSSGRETLLGRDCEEYRSTLEGVEEGREFRSGVRRLVSGPYVLLREVVDSAGGLMRMRAEAVALDEGVVDESDVDPPKC